LATCAFKRCRLMQHFVDDAVSQPDDDVLGVWVYLIQAP
jgi:hypothetical protein